MKVIKDNYTKDLQYECFWCQSILEVNDKDIKVDAAGDEYLYVHCVVKKHLYK